MKLLTINDSQHFFPNVLNSDLKHLILWLLERQPPPLHLLRTAGVAWWTMLRKHRLFPLLYVRLQRAGLIEAVVPFAAQLLRNDYLAALQLYLRQKVAARRLLHPLRAAGIEVILLKGADLRLRLYEDPASRPMTDLDLLIPKAALAKASSVLGRLAYGLSSDSLNPRPGFREHFRAGLHFKKPDRASLMVDLHWHIEAVANFYRLPYESLRRQAISWDYQGVPVKLLSPEHLLIHLCLHNYDELDQALRIVDLGLVLKRLPLDWRLFLAETDRFGCQAPLYLMLGQLARLLPQAVPAEVLTVLGNYHPSFWERMALDQNLNPLVRLFAPLYYHRRPGDWVRYFAALLWPHQDYLTAVHGKRARAAYLRRVLALFFPMLRK